MSVNEAHPVSLQVGIVGCGVAGLSAAIALRRAGHSVEIFERSRFVNETGAAIIIGPNGSRILHGWGFNDEQAAALDLSQIRRIKADTTELDSEEHFTNITEDYGDRWLMLHRADLHTELRKLAENPAPPTSGIEPNLATPVTNIDPEQGTITLEDGRNVQKDLVIVADGSHSKLITHITGQEQPVIRSPMSMYRFLQPMDDIMQHSEARQFFANQKPGFNTFYKTVVGRPGLLLNTYPCRGGSLLYCALLHPTRPKEKDLEGWDSPADYEDVITDAKGFHPSVQAICENATDVKVYNNMWRDPLPNFTRGKAILCGDAGHLMLPTHGQGASMAIEDAAALEVLFSHIDSIGDVQHRVKLFDELRLPRARAVQSMSNKMMGPPDKMIDEVRRYFGGEIPGPKAKTFDPEFNDFFFKYDVTEEARQLLRKNSQ